MEVKISLVKPNDILRVQASLLGLGKELEDGKMHDVIIKPHTKKRSKQANNYCWELLDQLAEKLETTKEELYRQIIRRVGVFDTVCVQEKAVGSLINGWQKHGIGWVAETDTSKIAGCKNVILYYGSSVYDTKQMKRLLDEIIIECEKAKIDTITPQQQADMLSLWETKGGAK